MGYRSQVSCVIYPTERNRDVGEERYNLIKTLMNTQFKDVFDYWHDPYFTWHDRQKVLEFTASAIKWYDGYPEIQRFNEMRDFFENELNEQISVEFARIGEEYNDIDIECSAYAENLLNINRSIETDF
jgi:hypothetical protein